MTKHKCQNNDKAQMSNDKTPILIFAIWALNLFCALNFVICNFSFAEDFTYESKGKRDPFIPLVGPGAVHQQVKGTADISSIEDVVLEGIVYDKNGNSSAIINGEVVKEGEKAGIVTVEKIEPKKVILGIEKQVYEVPLVKEKEGGE